MKILPHKKPVRVAVSAYIDGKSETIESMKLDAVDRLEKAQEASQGLMQVTLDGQRHSRAKDLALFTGLGLLPTVAAVGLGGHFGGVVGACVGGAVGLAVCTLPSTHFLGRALKAPQWKTDSRLALGGEASPSPVSEPGPERLRSLVQQNREQHPEARQVLFLSGHGDIDQVAHMPWNELSQSMEKTPVDVTILDACLTSQLEVMSHLAPWSGLVMASPHPIKARGLELSEILSPQNLEREDGTEAAVAMARECRSTTPSWVVLDSPRFQSEFLPGLDKLGRKLKQELTSGKRAEMKKVLAKSLGTDGWVGSRVDMGSFLKNLKASGLAPEEAVRAEESFRECLPFQKNKHTMSFHLRKGRKDPSLPEGWRDFLKELDYRFKPLF